MKHNLKITIILLAMFIATQFIGLYVVDFYSKVRVVDGTQINVTSPNLPFGLETPEVKSEKEYNQFFVSIVVAFILAIGIMFLLTKFKARFIIKFWFLFVVFVALGISLNAIIPAGKNTLAIATLLALIFAFLKIYGKNFYVHNATELLIYPGIAAVFVPILNIYTILILLILISIYDAWAVWHSGIMQKMAKFQINTLNIFSGFFVPYAGKKEKQKIKLMKQQYRAAKEKGSKKKMKEIKNKKIGVSVAILGGGDVIFPIITAGVMLKSIGIFSAIFVIAGATLGLAYLFFFAEKKKFYPAMPYITTGIFAGLILSWLIL